MTLNEIKTAMQNWTSMLNPASISAVQTLFNAGNSFFYTRDPNNTPAAGQTDAFVHAYPGVHNGKLIYMLISACYDNATTANIENHVQVCTLVNETPSPNSDGGIPLPEALGRINSWHLNSDAWIADNISSGTMYTSLNIPNNDSASGLQHLSFFALASSTAAPNVATADLIIQDSGDGKIIYADTINPVPPFPPSPSYLHESSFYLLSII